MVTSIYAVIAVLWIIFSSEILRAIVNNIDDYKSAEVYKGLLFVVITSLFLYYSLRFRDREDDRLNSEIMRSNEEWHNFFDSANDAMLIVDENRTILESNRHAKELFAVELSNVNIDSLDLKNTFEFNNLKTNEHVYPENYVYESGYTKAGGNTVPLEINIKPLVWNSKNCLIYLLRDITERKQYELMLKESEKKYRNLVEDSQDLIWAADSDFRITFINSASKNIFGIEPSEMTGRKFTEFMEPALAEKETDYISECVIQGKNTFRYESRVKGAGGRNKYLFVNATITRNIRGNFSAISGVSHDITDRVRLERKIENVTNLYSALTRINELLLRAKNEESILNDSCELTVVNGKFKTAWVGIVNEKTGDVEPKYFFGENEDYVKSLRININEAPGVRGPIVRALIEKTHYISNDVENDMFISRWRDLCLANRYRSFATFPIEVGDKVIGTLNIYDDKKNRFSNEITQILLQLMEDITFAMERFELEKERKQYENLFHKIVEQATIAVIMENHGEVIYANKAAINMFGARQPEDLTGKPFADFISGSNRGEIKELLEKVYSGKRSEENEIKLLKLDGGEINTIYSVIPFVINSRNGSLSFIRDITSEKVALEALQSSEEKWRSLFENTPSFVTTINRKYIITSANRAPLPLRAEEILGHSSLEYVDTKMKDEVRKVYDYVFESGEPSVYHTVGYGEYGREAFFRVQAIPQMKDGKVNQITLISSDMTETKRASDALRESQLRLKSIVDTALDAIITVDSALKIILFNQSAENIFNCSSDSAIGTSISRFIPDLIKSVKHTGKIQPGKVPDLSKVLGKGKYTMAERNSGEKFPIEASISRSTVEKNVFFTIILRDISERIQAENDLRDSYQKVRDLAAHLQSAREEERVNIAREIHDELGQELSALKMDISFLNKKIEKTRENPDWNAITDNLKSMTNIADQTIKTVRKISSQLRPDVLDKLGLSDALEWLAEDFSRRTAIRCRVESFDVPEDLNKNMQTVIYRISQESLTNIMRHAGASVVAIKLKSNKSAVTLEIIDNGKGITAEEIENGKSLGIVGMKERVYFVGGTFEIGGVRGKGTTVKVTIPLVKNEHGTE